MNLLHLLSVLVVEGGDYAQNKGAQTDEQFLLKPEDVRLDQSQERLLHLEVSELIEVVQITNEETHIFAEDSRRF